MDKILKIFQSVESKFSKTNPKEFVESHSIPSLIVPLNSLDTIYGMRFYKSHAKASEMYSTWEDYPFGPDYDMKVSIST